MEPEFLRLRLGFLLQPHMVRVILSPHTLITASAALVRTLPVTRLERSRPAADASREVVERWLLDGLM